MNNPLIELLDHEDFLEGSEWVRKEYLQREIIVKEGDQHGRVFLMDSGEANLVVNIDVEGQEQQSPSFCALSPGDIFGELSLYDDEPSSATIKAVSDCQVIEYHSLRLRQFMDVHPDVGYWVLNQLFGLTAQRLRGANARVSRLLSLGLSQR